MFLSWYRGLSSRQQLSGPRFVKLYAERLEDRLAPAATLSFPTGTTAASCSVLQVPVDINALNDGTHVGLLAFTLVISYPTGEFNTAAASASLGAIPLSVSSGASYWTLTIGGPADGQLNVNVTPGPGRRMEMPTVTSGSLVVLNLPILSTAAVGSQGIKVVASIGSARTSIVGANGTYILTTVSSGVYASGAINVTAGTVTPPTVPLTQTFSVSPGATLNVSAPGILTAGTSSCGMLSVVTVNGSAVSLGKPLMLTSGATLTVNEDGSFTYVPTGRTAATDTFSFQAMDMSGGLSNTGMVAVSVRFPLTLGPSSLPNSVVGAAYAETVSASGGMSPYTFSSTGTLPSGLTLSGSGILAGTPSLPGTFAFTVTVTDALASTNSQSYSIRIFPTAVYVDPSFTGRAGSDPVTDPGLGLSIGTTAFSSVAAALSNVEADTKLVLFGGTSSGVGVNITGPLRLIEVASNPKDVPAVSTVLISGQINNVIGLDVDAASTLTLAGNSTFVGSAAVNGILVVSGKLTAGSVQLMAPNSVLSGTGTVLAPLQVAGSGAKITGSLTISNPGGTAHRRAGRRRQCLDQRHHGFRQRHRLADRARR